MPGSVSCLQAASHVVVSVGAQGNTPRHINCSVQPPQPAGVIIILRAWTMKTSQWHVQSRQARLHHDPRSTIRNHTSGYNLSSCGLQRTELDTCDSRTVTLLLCCKGFCFNSEIRSQLYQSVRSKKYHKMFTSRSACYTMLHSFQFRRMQQSEEVNTLTAVGPTLSVNRVIRFT